MQTGLQLGKYLDLSLRFSCKGLCALPLVAVTLRSDQLIVHRVSYFILWDE